MNKFEFVKAVLIEIPEKIPEIPRYSSIIKEISVDVPPCLLPALTELAGDGCTHFNTLCTKIPKRAGYWVHINGFREKTL